MKTHITFTDAAKDIPEGVNFDPLTQTTITDLCFSVQTELDIAHEEPEEYLNHMTSQQFRAHKTRLKKFLKKYGGQ